MSDHRLEPLLRAHEPLDDLERAHLRRMWALAGHGPRAFDRCFYDPGHFTASAFVVCPDRERILLIHHAKLGRWLQPGGHIEPGDATPAAAARRELREETGLTAIEPIGEGLLDVDVHTIPARGDTPAHDHFDLRFGFVSRGAEASAGSDATAVQWVPVEALAGIDTDASVRRAVARLERWVSG